MSRLGHVRWPLSFPLSRSRAGFLTSVGGFYTPANVTSATLEEWQKADAGVTADGAANFNGSNQLLSIASNPTLQASGDFGISGWFNSSSVSVAQSLVSKDDNATNREYNVFLNADGNGSVSFFLGGTDVVNTGGGAFSASTWTHFAVTYSRSTTTAKLYINGVLKATNTSAAAPTVGTAAFHISSDSSGRFFSGSADSIVWWNGHAPTQVEVTALYNSGRGVAYANLAVVGIIAPTSWWKLSEQSGTRYDSVTATANNLTSNNAVTVTAGLVESTPVQGIFAAKFNGTNQTLTCSDSGMPTGTTSRSVSVWFYMTSAPATGNISSIFSYGTGVNTEAFSVGVVNNSGTTTILVIIQGSSIQGATALTPNVWYNLICTYDGTTYKIYLNGVLENSGTMTTNTTLGGTILLGCYLGNVFFFAGSIARLAFFANHILTAGEIAALQNNGQGLKGSQLAGAGVTAASPCWDLDPTEANGILTDSGGSKTLTNNNAVTFTAGPNAVPSVASQWLDQSANSNNQAQTTIANRPSYCQSVQNGLPALLFKGSDFLTKVFSGALSQPYDVYIVFKAYSTAKTTYLLSDASNGNVSAFTDASTGDWDVAAGTTQSSGVAEDTSPHVMRVNFNGVSSIFQLDGTTYSLPGSPGANTLGGILFGANYNAGSPNDNMIVYLCEAAVFSGTVSSSENTQLTNGLRQKWGF